MLVVALTGGIGSGKTTISNQFSDLGVPVIDADRVSRALVEPGSPVLDQVINAFGEGFRDSEGQLDRRRLREFIFNDHQARLTLESILHPAIRKEMARQLSELDAPYVILVIPLLAETGQMEMIDRVLVVDVPESLQIERVMQRDKISRQDAEQILGSQASRQVRLALADDVINNDQDPAALDHRVKELHQQYLELSAHLTIDGTRGS